MNLYWAVYKNLENEVIKLAENIHFDDKQINTYSIHISDLLIRTAVEIEAISRELYKESGGNMNFVDDHGNPRKPYFDSDCIQYLDQNWHITKKVVNVVAANFYFEKEENRILKPLKDCNKQKLGRWKKAYQAVKHDRTGSLSAGNIGNLIRAMAALYVLNLYKKEDNPEEQASGGTFDMSRGSDLFSVKSFVATSLKMDEHMNDGSIIIPVKCKRQECIDESVYIDRYTKESFLELHRNHMKDSEITMKNIIESAELQNYLQEHVEDKEIPLSEICIKCGEDLERKRLNIGADTVNIVEEDREKIKQAGINMLCKIFSFYYTTQGEKAKRELVLNKLQQIYPCV